MQTKYESILKSKRGYVSRWPNNKKAIMIISGGLDSIITTARLIKEHDIIIYPLHISRGQTNKDAEKSSIEFYTKYFQKKFPGKFNDPKYIELNIPPREIKDDLVPYTTKHGHPLRDTMLQMAAAQYAASLKAQGEDVNTIFCAVMPEDYFPHSNIESIRATNIAICQNMDNWDMLITSPNIDQHLTVRPIYKYDEIGWAFNNKFPAERTISCNIATASTELKNCGTCSSCTRRKEAFQKAGVEDITDYFA